MLRTDIDLLAKFVEEYPELDCDGATRLIQVAFEKARLQYKIKVGYVEDLATGEVLQPHFWVEVGKFIVDYKLRKWFGEEAPNGVFLPREAERYTYVGMETPFTLATSLILYQVVTGKTEAAA